MLYYPFHDTMVIMRIVMESKTKSKSKFPSIFKLIPLALLFSFLFVWIVDKSNPLVIFTDLLGFRRYTVKYETFDVSFDETVSDGFKEEIINSLDSIEFNEKKRFKFVEKKGLVLSTESKDDSKKLASIDLIPVVHRYSLKDSVKLDELKGKKIYILNSLFEGFLKEKYEVEVEVLDSYDTLLGRLKENDESIALLEFEDIGYESKIVELDGKYFLDNMEGSISFDFYVSNVDSKDEYILDVIRRNVSICKKSIDKEKIAKVNMGGVVAISRALLSKMVSMRSTTYPADVLGDFLADADLTHVSNEASFAKNCTAGSGMSFCTKDEHIDVLKKSGVDIVELTGNHNNDYGSANNTRTIEMYKALGMDYFGGGLNKEDASKILYKEVNGTKLAFLGYNYYDTLYNNVHALAGESTAGANWYSEEKLKKDIDEAKKNADVVTVSFQFQECYCYPASDVIYPICYKPLSNPDQKGVFRKAVDLGANIVVGTQAHQPQTFESYNGGMIFYGLGNLFFDQAIWIGTRQGLVLSNYFYDGKYIQTKITPIYMDRNLQPRFATREEGDLLMKLLKNAR